MGGRTRNFAERLKRAGASWSMVFVSTHATEIQENKWDLYFQFVTSYQADKGLQRFSCFSPAFVFDLCKQQYEGDLGAAATCAASATTAIAAEESREMQNTIVTRKLRIAHHGMVQNGEMNQPQKMDNSSRCRSDINTQDPIVGNSSISRNSPKWGDQTAAKDTLYFSACPSDDDASYVEAEKASWDSVKWSDSKTTKDAPKHSLQSSDDEKWGYNVNTGCSFLLDAPKLGDQITAKVSANFSQHSSGGEKDHGVKTAMQEPILNC